MFFPDVGPVEEWHLVGYGDAGIRSMPDKVSSVGGQVVLLANQNQNVACVLHWKIQKVASKSCQLIGRQTLAIVATKQMYGDIIDSVPVTIFTDSRNLYEAVYSSSLVDDAWLITDIAIIKDAIKD